MEPGEVNPAKCDRSLLEIFRQGPVGEGFWPGTPDDHGQILQKDGHADGRDQCGQARGLSQGTICKYIQEHATDGTAGHGQEKSDIKWQAQKGNEGNGEKCAKHVDFAVCEIDELDNAVDHGVSHGDHGVNAAYGQSVNKLLKKQASPIISSH